jgi:predicted  nucleic acid-binding Zn-ribbon protein
VRAENRHHASRLAPMSGEPNAADRDAEVLELRVAELERLLERARAEVDEARARIDRLAAEQASALRALHTAERRRGSLAYRLVGELRTRLRRPR